MDDESNLTKADDPMLLQNMKIIQVCQELRFVFLI